MSSCKSVGMPELLDVLINGFKNFHQSLLLGFYVFNLFAISSIRDFFDLRIRFVISFLYCL